MNKNFKNIKGNIRLIEMGIPKIQEILNKEIKTKEDINKLDYLIKHFNIHINESCKEMKRINKLYKEIRKNKNE